jgi:hypothetical protein
VGRQDEPQDHLAVALSLGLRMALMRSTTAASTWMKHWPRSRCVRNRANLEQSRSYGMMDRITNAGGCALSGARFVDKRLRTVHRCDIEASRS